MGIFNFTENIINANCLKASTECMTSVDDKYGKGDREADFVYALLMMSNALTGSDLLSVIRMIDTYKNAVKNISQDKLKRIILLNSIVLIQHFRLLDGFFESFNMSLKRIEIILADSTDKIYCKEYFSEIDKFKLHIGKITQYYVQDFSNVIGIQNPFLLVGLGKKYLSLLQSDYMNTVMSQVIKEFNVRNPGDNLS